MIALEGAVWFLFAFASGEAPDHLRNQLDYNTATYGPFAVEADCLASLREMKARPPGAACRDLKGMAGPGAVHRCHERARKAPAWKCAPLDRHSPEAKRMAQRILLHERSNAMAREVGGPPHHETE